ncbi:MAG: hypothetical protein AAF928_13350 [Myxococcota bacterium]
MRKPDHVHYSTVEFEVEVGAHDYETVSALVAIKGCVPPGEYPVLYEPVNRQLRPALPEKGVSPAVWLGQSFATMPMMGTAMTSVRGFPMQNVLSAAAGALAQAGHHQAAAKLSAGGGNVQVVYLGGSAGGGGSSFGGSAGSHRDGHGFSAAPSSGGDGRGWSRR